MILVWYPHTSKKKYDIHEFELSLGSTYAVWNKFQANLFLKKQTFIPYTTNLTQCETSKKRISFLIITLLTWIKYHSNTRSYSAKNKISYNHSSIISHAISTNNNMPYFNITLTSLKKIPSRLLSISWLKAHLSSFRNYIKFPANYTPPSRIQFYFDIQNNILFKQ